MCGVGVGGVYAPSRTERKSSQNDDLNIITVKGAFHPQMNLCRYMSSLNESSHCIVGTATLTGGIDAFVPNITTLHTSPGKLIIEM